MKMRIPILSVLFVIFRAWPLAKLRTRQTLRAPLRMQQEQCFLGQRSPCKT